MSALNTMAIGRCATSRCGARALRRINDTKSDAGRRTIPLPRLAITALTERRNLPHLGEQVVIVLFARAGPTASITTARARNCAPRRRDLRRHPKYPVAQV